MSPPAKQLPGGMAKVTSKGQITIPKAIRRALGIKEGCDILFVPVRGEVMVRVLPPAPKLSELAGSLKIKDALDLHMIDDIVSASILAGSKPEITKK